MKCIFSVDVEDWYHILDVQSTPSISQWDALPSRVEQNFLKLLDLFDEHGVSVTCFFLGWVAEKHPRLVKEAERRGHEIASHGFAHRLVYQMTPREFYEDSLRAKRVLEDTAARSVIGFRCPGFSVTRQVPWFFDKLIEAGYRYDSSIFPAPRAHGGMGGANRFPYLIRTHNGDLAELPVTVTEILGIPICCFGGGYLRLFPYAFIKSMSTKVLNEGRPVVYFIHPREIDVIQPRLPMPPWRRFKSYVNLRTTAQKISRLLRDFPVTTFADFIAESASHLPVTGEVVGARHA